MAEFAVVCSDKKFSLGGFRRVEDETWFKNTQVSDRSPDEASNVTSASPLLEDVISGSDRYAMIPIGELLEIAIPPI